MAFSNAAEFRQGNILGKDNRHWFHAKFHERYRLFYRFSSKEKVIIYAWVNDERTLRKAGSKTDPYSVFRSMLESGNPPSTMEQLLAHAKELKAKTDVGGCLVSNRDAPPTCAGVLLAQSHRGMDAHDKLHQMFRKSSSDYPVQAVVPRTAEKA